MKLLPSNLVSQFHEIINILTVSDELQFDWTKLKTQLVTRTILIPNQKIFWNIFFSVLRSRFGWLQGYLKCIWVNTHQIYRL